MPKTLFNAMIWAGSEDVLDGFYVELTDDFSTGAWWPTIEICKLWAARQGADKILIV